MSPDTMRERLSALIDGEGEFRAQTAQAAAFVRQVACDEAARRDWLLYARIGDVLRSADLAAMPHEEQFLQRVSAAIAREPIVLQPQAGNRAQRARRHPHWTTRLAAGMAAIGGVAVMAWVALPGLQQGDQQPLRAASAVARSAVQTPVAAPAGAWQLQVSDTGTMAAPQPLSQSAGPRLVADAANGGAAGVAPPTQSAAVAVQMPMVEYLLAHQQMAGGMMPFVPATLRVVAERPVGPIAASHR